MSESVLTPEVPDAHQTNRKTTEHVGSKDFLRLARSAGNAVTTERRRDYSPTLGPRAEKSRRRLIECARELFYQRGYGGTTVSDIAEAAGCSLGTFYSYFADINDVLRALALDYITESSQRGIENWDVATGKAGLKKMITDYIANFHESRNFMELWECAKVSDPALRQLGIEHSAVYRKHAASSLQLGADADLLRKDYPTDALADALTAMLERYCYNRLALRGDSLQSVLNAAGMLADLWVSALELQL